MIPRLRDKYKNEISKNLMTKLSLKNLHAVPKIEKIVVNMGLGADALDKKKLEICVKDMASITGQHPVITKFKKSISNFKSRKGANAGLKVTLRNDRMYEFLDRLVNIALPRVKDFKGLKDNIDLMYGFDNNSSLEFDNLVCFTLKLESEAYMNLYRKNMKEFLYSYHNIDSGISKDKSELLRERDFNLDKVNKLSNIYNAFCKPLWIF